MILVIRLEQMPSFFLDISWLCFFFFTKVTGLNWTEANWGKRQLHSLLIFGGRRWQSKEPCTQSATSTGQEPVACDSCQCHSLFATACVTVYCPCPVTSESGGMSKAQKLGSQGGTWTFLRGLLFWPSQEILRNSQTQIETIEQFVSFLVEGA